MKPSGKELSMINLQQNGIYKIIKELKYRSLTSIAMFIILFGIGLSLSRNIINHLIKLFPFHKTIFIQTSLTDPWIVSIKIAFLFGIVFSFPIIIYNLLKFNENLLPRRNTFQIYTGITISYITFFIGMIFAYKICLSSLMYLLYGYGTVLKSITPAYELNSYMNFCLDTIIITGFAFALPSAIIYGAKTKILNRPILKKLFKFFFIFIIIISFITAFINPLFEFILFLILALLFYIVSLFICKLFEIIL